MVVRISNSGEISPGPLSNLPSMETLLRNNFSVSPDCQKLLFVVSRPRPAMRPIRVLLN